MPVLGVMPMRILSPARPSRVRWLPEVILIVVAVGCSLLLVGFMPESSVISSMCPVLWRRHLSFLSDLEATVVVVEIELRRGNEMDLAEGVRAHQLQRSIWWSYGSCREPVFPGELRLLRAEGRPFLFLWALKPFRRQVLRSFGGHGVQQRPWRFCRPKWSVPGDGKARSERKQQWTRLLFHLSVRGPPRKSQGLVCNFMFLLGPFVNCTVSLVYV